MESEQAWLGGGNDELESQKLVLAQAQKGEAILTLWDLFPIVKTNFQCKFTLI